MKYGLDHGLTVIDTAEMYGNGAAESLIGGFLRDYNRSEIYLISKFYPSHADKKQMRTALTNSLTRLKTDYLDLYLLHWRGATPLAETLEGLQDLKKEGLIRQYGVSNFDVDDMDQLTLEPGGDQVVANEVLYNLQSRGIEYDLLPRQKQAGITTIGYSPYGSGTGKSIRLTPALVDLAKAKGISTHQLMHGCSGITMFYRFPAPAKPVIWPRTLRPPMSPLRRMNWHYLTKLSRHHVTTFRLK